MRERGHFPLAAALQALIQRFEVLIVLGADRRGLEEYGTDTGSSGFG
jgi:hypothetical protein